MRKLLTENRDKVQNYQPVQLPLTDAVVRSMLEELQDSINLMRGFMMIDLPDDPRIVQFETAICRATGEVVCKLFVDEDALQQYNDIKIRRSSFRVVR